MTNRERQNATLAFNKLSDRGAILETFHPWTLTLDNFKKGGLPDEIAGKVYSLHKEILEREDIYLDVLRADGVNNYETFLGFDSVKRISVLPPFRFFESKIIEETDEYVIKQEVDGWQKKYYKNSTLIQEIRPVIENEEDWELAKKQAILEVEKYYCDENINKIFLGYKEGHVKGEYTIRLDIEGFFWFPRTLMGVEGHLFAFYDYPELMHDMNEFLLGLYIDRLDKVLEILPADVVYIKEDLSGGNGPMLSVQQFNEFVGAYYKKLVPFLKKKGVQHIFVDTDGDFKELIPHFMEAGIEGFLPLDVKAGMDIVEIRKLYPSLKFIGGFNKLLIAEGKAAIDAEFQRLLPVIRQGGYIPGSDHQVDPATSYDDYKYYISRLKEVMKEAGKDI